MDFLIEVVIHIAATDVMSKRVFDRGEAAIVHEGRAVGEVAQGGRLEATQVGILLGDGVAAGIVEVAAGIGADAEIVKLVVGEESVVLLMVWQTAQLAFLGSVKSLNPRWAAGESAFLS